MSGKSEQEKEAGKVQGNIYTQLGDARAIKPTITNRFDNYKHQFDFDTMKGNLDKSFQNKAGAISSDAATDVAANKKSTMRSLASRGITGGSIVDDTISKTSNPIISGKYKSIRDLSNQNLDREASMMEMFNRFGIDISKLGSDVDLQNVMNEFRKSGNISQILGLAGANVGNFDDTTWLDDIFEGVNTAANLVGSFSGGGGKQ